MRPSGSSRLARHSRRPALAMIGASVSRFVLAGVGVAAILYSVIGVGVIRAILRSPGAIPPRTAEDRMMLRRFAVVGSRRSDRHHDRQWDLRGNPTSGTAGPVGSADRRNPLPAAGVDLPSAAILLRWAGSFALVTVLTIVLVPVHAQVGAADAWFVIPTFGCTRGGLGDVRVQSARSTISLARSRINRLSVTDRRSKT